GTGGSDAPLELCRCRGVSPEWIPQFWPAVPERVSGAVEWRRTARAAGRHVYRCSVTEIDRPCAMPQRAAHFATVAGRFSKPEISRWPTSEWRAALWIPRRIESDRQSKRVWT